MKNSWVDDSDDESPTPELYTKNGKKYKLEYSTITEGGKKYKITRKYLVTERTTQVPKEVVERRKNWVKFGFDPNSRESQSVTNRSEETVDFEEPLQFGEEAGDSSKAVVEALQKALNAGGQTDYDKRASGAAAALTPSGGGDKYIPAHKRMAMNGGGSSYSSHQEDDELTLRVSNITEEATDDDLRDLFHKFGPFQRVYLATAKADCTICFISPAPPGNVGIAHISGTMYKANQKGMRYLRDNKCGELIKDMTKTFKYAKLPRKGGGRGPKRGHHDPDLPRYYITGRGTGAFIQKGGGDSKSDSENLFRLYNSVGVKQGLFDITGKDTFTKVSRGFAYIKFRSRDLATRAMQELNGHGYGHLILKVERAKPSNRDSAPRGNSMKYASGYGRALPQSGPSKPVGRA